MSECACHHCVTACKTYPGWMTPEEARKIATFLGLSLKELFEQYLVVDWWEDYPISWPVLGPAVVGQTPGVEMPSSTRKRGQCVFLTKAGMRRIHPVKLSECREYVHTMTSVDVYDNHTAPARAWKHSGAPVLLEALGRTPEYGRRAHGDND